MHMFKKQKTKTKTKQKQGNYGLMKERQLAKKGVTVCTLVDHSYILFKF